MFFLGLIASLAVAQIQIKNPGIMVMSPPDYTQSQINDHAISFLKSQDVLAFVAVVTPDTYFHKTFLLNDEGKSISTSYMPSSYYRPNNNTIIITGMSKKSRDSFNPYGATDLTSVVFLSTVNSFLSKIRISRRSKMY